MIENTTPQAFAEVYNIIEHTNEDLRKKIPQKFIELLEKNRDLNYPVNIDYSKNIQEQKLLKETEVILSLIYRDYLVSDEKRKELVEQDKKQIEEEQNKYKFDYDKVFAKVEKKKKENDITREKQLIEMQEENFFSKIMKKIYDILKKIKIL